MQFSEDFVCNDEQKMKIHFSSEYMYARKYFHLHSNAGEKCEDGEML